MTWATIHYLTDSTMAVEFPFSQRHKTAIAQMTGAEFDGATKRWDVPVARLGDVVTFFWPNVTIDYAVLRARDEQLQAMFRGYRDMGVRFDVVGGKVVCDHAVLNDWFAAHSMALHVNALLVVLQSSDIKKEAPKPTERPRIDAKRQDGQNHVAPTIVESRPVSASQTGNGDIALWLRGVVNAQKREDAKADMLRRKKVKKLSESQIDP